MPPQQDYDLGWVDRVEVVTRLNWPCCTARIMCWQLELQDVQGSPMYTYPFTTTQDSYTFRDPVTDPAVKATCSLAPPPPPMSPRPVTPKCPGAAGEYVHFLRFTWSNSTNCPASGFLQIAEVRLIYNGYNVALGKSASAGDFYQSNANYNGQQAVDGKDNTFYHSNTFTSAAYLLIDLQVSARRASHCLQPCLQPCTQP